MNNEIGFVSDVIVGKPLLSPESLGFYSYYVTDERFLPRILVDLEIFTSTSQVRKNRPDLWRELIKPDIEEIKIGKRRLWLLIGE